MGCTTSKPRENNDCKIIEQKPQSFSPKARNGSSKISQNLPCDRAQDIEPQENEQQQQSQNNPEEISQESSQGVIKLSDDDKEKPSIQQKITLPNIPEATINTTQNSKNSKNTEEVIKDDVSNESDNIKPIEYKNHMNYTIDYNSFNSSEFYKLQQYQFNKTTTQKMLKYLKLNQKIDIYVNEQAQQYEQIKTISTHFNFTNFLYKCQKETQNIINNQLIASKIQQAQLNLNISDFAILEDFIKLTKWDLKYFVGNLDLTGCTEQQVQSFLKSFFANTNLEKATLYLTQNKIQNLRLPKLKISNSLKHLTLTLKDTDKQNEFCVKDLDYFLLSAFQLESLMLQMHFTNICLFNQVGSVINSIQNLKKLTLDFQACAIQQEDFISFLEFFINNQILRELYLDFQTTDTIIPENISSIINSMKLTVFSLYPGNTCNLDYITKILTTNTTIQHFIYKNCQPNGKVENISQEIQPQIKLINMICKVEEFDIDFFDSFKNVKQVFFKIYQYSYKITNDELKDHLNTVLNDEQNKRLNITIAH